MTRWTYAELPDLTGLRAVVTGANSGIGFVEARELGRQGADVVLAVRNTEAGEEAAHKLRVAGTRGEVSVARLDLASQASVREFAEAFTGPLDLLVNNAGVMTPPRYRETTDGHELQFGTNHLGHFALTGLLLPRLLEAPASRVTTVSSIAHHNGDGEVANGNPEASYSPNTSYGRSKLANLLFADELHRRAQAAGSTLTSNAAHPGVSSTNLFSSKDGMGSVPVLGTLGKLAITALFPAPEKGAEAIVYAATVADGGTYSGPTGIRESRGPVGEAKRSRFARDQALAQQLWERSEELTGVRFEF